jgi:hypothetical protein
LSRFRKSIPKKHPPQPQQEKRKDKNDPLCKNDYVQDMYRHFSARETSTSVRPLYMEEQSHLNELMRAILIDWLVDVHYSFRLSLATLFLTVNLIDRFLELSPGVSRRDFQLVGATALWIASKYEEIRPMDIYQLVDVCDACYTKQQIFRQEKEMLMAHMAMYILEGTLGSYNLLHYLPSQMAAASVYLARKTLLDDTTTTTAVWSGSLEDYTGYTKEEIIPVAKAIWMERESEGELNLTAVQKKYCTVQYSSVATKPLKGV